MAFSTLTNDTLGTIPLAAGVVTTFRMGAKNPVRELIDYTTYIHDNNTIHKRPTTVSSNAHGNGNTRGREYCT